MAMSNKQKLLYLMKEIDNLVDLLVKVDESSEHLDTLTEQKQKVIDLLPITPADERKDGTYPLHRLLSCRPLTKTEIPLDVLEKIRNSGFNVNSLSYKDIDHTTSIEDKCLNLAIQNDHFAAARWLVQHGADCNNSSEELSCDWHISKTPIAELASKANAPLDLFCLLATPKSLNDEEANTTLPLELAIDNGNTEHALRLIKLGSPMKSKNGFMMEGYLDALAIIHGQTKTVQRVQHRTYHSIGIPVDVLAHSMEYNDELFTRLIPSQAIDILTCVAKVLQMNILHKNENDSKGKSESNARPTPPIRCKILSRLFQYISPTDQKNICFTKHEETRQSRYGPNKYRRDGTKYRYQDERCDIL